MAESRAFLCFSPGVSHQNELYRHKVSSMVKVNWVVRTLGTLKGQIKSHASPLGDDTGTPLRCIPPRAS